VVHEVKNCSHKGPKLGTSLFSVAENPNTLAIQAIGSIIFRSFVAEKSQYPHIFEKNNYPLL